MPFASMQWMPVDLPVQVFWSASPCFALCHLIPLQFLSRHFFKTSPVYHCPLPRFTSNLKYFKAISGDPCGFSCRLSRCCAPRRTVRGKWGASSSGWPRHTCSHNPCSHTCCQPQPHRYRCGRGPARLGWARSCSGPLSGPLSGPCCWISGPCHGDVVGRDPRCSDS